MPIDIISSLKNTADEFANKSIFGELVSNPVIIAAIITLLLSIMLYLETDTSFSTVFYTFIIVCGIVVIHDTVLRSQIKEYHESEAGIDIIRNVHNTPTDDNDIVDPRNDTQQIKDSYHDNLVPKSINDYTN